MLAYAASIAGLFFVGAFGVRAIRQLTLKPERLDIGLANDEFIPSTRSSELALSSDGTLIAYASSKRMAAMPNMSSGPAARGRFGADRRHEWGDALDGHDRANLRSSDRPGYSAGPSVVRWAARRFSRPTANGLASGTRRLERCARSRLAAARQSRSATR